MHLIGRLLVETAPEALGIFAAETVIRSAQAYMFIKGAEKMKIFSKAKRVATKFRRKEIDRDAIFNDSIDASTDAF